MCCAVIIINYFLVDKMEVESLILLSPQVLLRSDQGRYIRRTDFSLNVYIIKFYDFYLFHYIH